MVPAQRPLLISTRVQVAMDKVSRSSDNRSSRACSLNRKFRVLSAADEGRSSSDNAPHCKGAKVLDHTQRYTLDVPEGAPEAHEILFEGEADESPDWEAGDIVIRVRSKKDKGGFRRKESSLYWKETISVDEASCRFESFC